MMLDNLLINIIPVTILFSFGIANSYEEKTVYTQALLTITYGGKKLKPRAHYVEKSPKTDAKGKLFYAGKDADWCYTLPSPVPQTERWIALIPQSNNCTCKDKLVLAEKNNVSAAIIYQYGCEDPDYIGHGIVSVVISKSDADNLINIYDPQHPNRIHCEITKGKKYIEKQFRVSKTSVLFVLVSFILLMCISLAWLVFYYVQRFRHIYRNDRKEVSINYITS